MNNVNKLAPFLSNVKNIDWSGGVFICSIFRQELLLPRKNITYLVARFKM